jgi:hypothetical protein
LREESDGENDPHSPAVPRGLEEVEVGARFGNITLDGKSLSDLAIGEVDEWVSLAVVGVIFGEDCDGLSVTTFGDQPSIEHEPKSFI